MTVFGAAYTTRDEFLKPAGPKSPGARPIYHQQAIEYPGTTRDFRYTTTLSKSKAVRLDDDPSGRIAVIVADPATGSESRFVPKTDSYVYANLTGFKLDGLSKFESLQRQYYTREGASLIPALLKEDTVIRYFPEQTDIEGTGAHLDQARILKVQTQGVNTAVLLELTTPQGLTIKQERIFPTTDRREIARVLFGDTTVLAVGQKIRTIPTNRFVYAHLSDMPGEAPSQLVPVARQVGNFPFFIIGAGAKLPLSATTTALIRELGIKENTVALWANQRLVTLAAIYFAQKDLKQPSTTARKGYTPGLLRPAVDNLPKPEYSTKRVKALNVSFGEHSIAQKISIDMSNEDLLKLGAAISTGHYRVPRLAKIKALSFDIERLPSQDGRSYVVRIPPGFPKDKAWVAMVRNLLNDPDVQRAIHARCSSFERNLRGGKNTSLVGLRINIPITRGRFDPGRLAVQEYDLLEK